MTQESEKNEGGRGIFERLADVGEGAIQRVGEMPGMGKVAEALMNLRERTDELQRRVRGLDAMEQRLSDLERRVSSLEGGTDIATLASETPPAPPMGATIPPPGPPPSSVPTTDPTAGTAGSEETSTSSSA